MLAVLCVPFATSYVHHELSASRQVEELAPILPEKTAVLYAAPDVEYRRSGPAGERCILLAAKVLATELSEQDVADFFRRTEERMLNPITVVWNRGPEVWLQDRLVTEEPRRLLLNSEELPPLVTSLLRHHNFLLGDVRRVVVYRAKSVAAGFDPRCLG